MDTNQTIDGVSRELLERVTSQSLGMSAKKDRAEAANELRALLDRASPPLKECPEGYGHSGHWCGADYDCWLDPRPKNER